MNRYAALLSNLILLLALGLLSWSGYLLLRFNAPIIRHDLLLATGLVINLALLGATAWQRRKIHSLRQRLLALLITTAAVVLIVNSILNAVLIDYFQPLSLYDQAIYPAIGGFLLLILLSLVPVISSLFRRQLALRYVSTSLLALLIIGQFTALKLLQRDFDYTNIEGEPLHLFMAGEQGYEIFRIPTLLVLPKGSQLASGETLSADRILVMAEARRNGSLDDGDIDLVQKVSSDGGTSWSELQLVQRYGSHPATTSATQSAPQSNSQTGKIGNSTPVFDPQSGEVVLLYITVSQNKEYATWQINSPDGGNSWGEPKFVYDGIVGPGHGIAIQGGEYHGRLVVPGYHQGGSLSLYSDDHGVSWQRSDSLSDGNEAEIAQVNQQGELLMVVRTNQPVSQPHEPLHKLLVRSVDGGQSWSGFETATDLKEPICMSSIVRSGDSLYYSHPDDFYSRGQMTIASSSDQGRRFTSRKLIYQGAAGYSDMGVAHNGDLLLVFENGAIEYDERLTFIRSRAF